MGLQPPKSQKLVIFYIYLPQRSISPYAIFLQIWHGGVSHVPTITLTFIFVVLKMWSYGSQNRKKMAIFGINLPLRKNPGVRRELEYRCTTRNLPLCNGTVIVLKITPLHSVSIITNFLIPKRDRQTDRQKTLHVFV